MNELPVEVSLHFLENFRLLMQSCCFLFFFSRPFHEKFKFLKNCPYHFHKILHSHSTPKGAPACSKASKSYDWNVRNTAKISPKMAKKQSFFDLFRFSHQVFIFIFQVHFKFISSYFIFKFSSLFRQLAFSALKKLVYL